MFEKIQRPKFLLEWWRPLKSLSFEIAPHHSYLCLSADSSVWNSPSSSSDCGSVLILFRWALRSERDIFFVVSPLRASSFSPAIRRGASSVPKNLSSLIYFIFMFFFLKLLPSFSLSVESSPGSSSSKMAISSSSELTFLFISSISSSASSWIKILGQVKNIISDGLHLVHP